MCSRPPCQLASTRYGRVMLMDDVAYLLFFVGVFFKMNSLKKIDDAYDFVRMYVHVGLLIVFRLGFFFPSL